MNDLLTISQIRKNESEAFERIYILYRDEFCLWLRKRTALTLEESKEIYQLSMVILYENIRDGKLTNLTSTLKTYLFSIGLNKARDFKKSREKYNANLDPLNLQLFTEDVSQEELEGKFQVIEKCLEQLGRPCKEILIDFYYFKFNMKDIAQRFGYKNPDSAKNQKAKCIKKLKVLVFNQLQHVA